MRFAAGVGSVERDNVARKRAIEIVVSEPIDRHPCLQIDRVVGGIGIIGLDRDVLIADDVDCFEPSDPERDVNLFIRLTVIDRGRAFEVRVGDEDLF